MTAGYLAIDQGTTSSRAIVFDVNGRRVAHAQHEFQQYFPRNGWVEHDLEEIWRSVVEVVQDVLAQAEQRSVSVRALGITNQRETTAVWERDTGRAIYPAIVWQDRRTASFCANLILDGAQKEITQRSGLMVDPYFSASKIGWILDNVDGARARAESGELAFGTVDTFLLWRLTGGKVHATDATNASRTSLFNIVENCWDDELLRIFNIPPALLPRVCDTAGEFGRCSAQEIGKSMPVLAMIGDQQSAAIGQGCIFPGSIKATYGTGCFTILNVGDNVVRSSNRLLSTVAYSIDGKASYALEGSLYVAGAVVQWLRDKVGFVSSSSETESIAQAMDSNDAVYFVPAFTGLAAPHWDSNARGLICGLTRDSSPNQITRAALESVAYQTNDLLQAMANDGACPTLLRVDGGMSRNNWLMQFLADITGIRIERPTNTETTAAGAAQLAGLIDGAYASLEDMTRTWQRDRVFEPSMETSQRSRLLAGWDLAVRKTLLS